MNHIDLATETDKKNGLGFWAKAFLATTWEERRRADAAEAEVRALKKELSRYK